MLSLQPIIAQGSVYSITCYALIDDCACHMGDMHAEANVVMRPLARLMM